MINRKGQVKSSLWRILQSAEVDLGDSAYPYPERAMLTLLNELQSPVWDDNTITRKILADEAIFPMGSVIASQISMIGLYPILCEMLVEMYQHSRENETIFCP